MRSRGQVQNSSHPGHGVEEAVARCGGEADAHKDSQKNRDPMLATIGQLTLERDFLPRVLNQSVERNVVGKSTEKYR